MQASTQILKRWVTARARACRLGVLSWRSDPADGPQVVFSSRHGVPRVHDSLDHFERYVEELWTATETV